MDPQQPNMAALIQALIGEEEMRRMQQMQMAQGQHMGGQSAMGQPGVGDPQIDELAALIQGQRQGAMQQMQGPIDPMYLDQRRQMMPQQGLDERMPQPRPRAPRFEGYR